MDRPGLMDKMVNAYKLQETLKKELVLHSRSYRTSYPILGARIGNVRKISVSISEDSADWLEAQVEANNYRNVSHAVDSVIRDAKKSRQTYRPLPLSALSDDHY